MLILNIVFISSFVTNYKMCREFMGPRSLSIILSLLCLKTIIITISLSQFQLKFLPSHFHKIHVVLSFYSVVRLVDITVEQEVIQAVNKKHRSDPDDSVSLYLFHVSFTLLTRRNNCQC
jgi:hypothetical protein